METFLMSGKYSAMSLAEASADRTKKAKTLVKRYKGRIQSIYATLGQHDLVMIAEFPSVQEAMQASIALTKLTGIGFNTTPAVPVDVFDKMLAEE